RRGRGDRRPFHARRGDRGERHTQPGDSRAPDGPYPSVPRPPGRRSSYRTCHRIGPPLTKQSLSRWTVEDSRARRCKRWSLYPDDVVDLTVAEMDLPVAAPVMAAVRDAVEREAFGYPLPDHASGLPATAADWLGRQGLVVPAEQLRLLADVIKGIVLGLRWLTPPGSPVAVITPTYSRFADAVEAAERPLIEVPMLHGD